MKICNVIAAFAVIAALGIAVAYIGNSGNILGDGGAGIACTMEAKICPDGSAVGRTGPNCEFTECPQGVGRDAAIAIGKSATINGTLIGVLELIEDSRCPIDVQCIQAGTVRVRVAIDSYNRDFTFALNEAKVVGNAIVTLASVTPAQKFSTETAQLEDYRFTFTVSKQGPVDIIPSNSGIRGVVMLGPMCPVERIPPDPECANKGYETRISVFRAGNNINPVVTTYSNSQGFFETSLSPGDYIVFAEGKGLLSGCSSVAVTVSPANYTFATIQCDTGIR